MTEDNFEPIDADALLVTFILNETVFGIDTNDIQEVVRVGKITPVHHAPVCVVGIRNLRGRIVTVIDLKCRLEMGSVEENFESRIIIVEWQGEPIGLLVDRMADTVVADPEAITPPPANMNVARSRNLRGIHRCGERIVAILDLNAIMMSDQQISQTSTWSSEAA